MWFYWEISKEDLSNTLYYYLLNANNKCWWYVRPCIPGNYIRYDLNMPKSLPFRKGGPPDFHKDSPLTVQGHFQAKLVGKLCYKTRFFSEATSQQVVFHNYKLFICSQSEVSFQIIRWSLSRERHPHFTYLRLSLTTVCGNRYRNTRWWVTRSHFFMSSSASRYIFCD